MDKIFQIDIDLNKQKKYTNSLKQRVKFNMIKSELNEIEINNYINDEEPLMQEYINESYDKKVLQTLKKKPLAKIPLSEEDYYRIVEMAWQDRTHFDVIYTNYGLNENEIKKLMRSLISPNAFKRWRKRVQGRKTKHVKKCLHTPTRFQGPW